MTERENLPVVIIAQELAATTEKRGSLVARGMAAVLSKIQLALTKDSDALYRQARGLYDHISNQGVEGVQGFIRFGFTESQMMDAFHHLATAGYGKAYFPLCKLYGGMQSFKGDPEQAERFHKLAHDWLHANQHLNDPEIWHDLGAFYEGENVELAIHWFQKAAEAGNVSSMWGLVGAYEYKEDWENALYWQIMAAEAGHEEAQRGLEMQHEHGDLAEKIGDEQVFDWYVWSAEQGHLWAQLFLAEAYRFGDVIERDDELAVHWYLQAAEQGNAEAQCGLGYMYWGRRDMEQAVYWTLKSAEQGYDKAKSHLYMLTVSDDLEESDFQKILKWNQEAAEQGDAHAQCIIGRKYWNGHGVEQSDEQAVYWFRKAAEQGHVVAQEALKELGIDWENT